MPEEELASRAGEAYKKLRGIRIAGLRVGVPPHLNPGDGRVHGTLTSRMREGLADR